MKIYLLLKVGCAECTGGDDSLIGHRSFHESVKDAKHMAMVVGDVDEDDWHLSVDDYDADAWYSGTASGSWEIIPLELKIGGTQ